RVAYVCFALKERVDELGALVDSSAFEELRTLGQRRNSPGNVEVDAPHEDLVADERIKTGPLGAVVRFDQLVDPAGELRHVGPLQRGRLERDGGLAVRITSPIAGLGAV